MKNTPETEQPFETLNPALSSEADYSSLANYDERLNHLLRVAASVFARVGYHQASMRTVSKEAGMSLSGLYHYLDSKDEMLFLIQFRSFSSLLASLKERLQSIDAPRERLHILVRNHILFFADHIAELKVCSHELDSLKGSAYESCREIRREYYKIARTIIDDIADESPTLPFHFDSRIATISLFGTLNWLYRWYNPQRDCSPKTLANQIAQQFLHGLVCPSKDDGL